MDKRISENISFKLFLNAMIRNHKGASSFFITNKAVRTVLGWFREIV